MAALTIRLLGSFEARLGAGPPVSLPTKKARALLAYLAARPAQARSRDEIAELLWGARADEQARGSLRRTLSDLRKALPLDDGAWLVSEGDAVKLDARSVEVDVAQFERLAAGDAGALAQAAELYRGEFLAGFGLEEQTFEEWLRSERERLRQLAVKTLASLLAHHAAGEALEPAIQTGARLLAIDPANEPAHRTLMQLYLRQGRRSDALRQYRTCRETLLRELGVGPDAATEALHRELQQPAIDEPRDPTDAENAHEIPPPQYDKPSIAVLPFANLSGDPEQAYFADGLVEDIIGALSRISALWVIARASTFSYKGKPIDVKRIARELGVRYIMEGSVRRSAERVRVTAQLADAVTGRQVWSERFDRPMADLFDIQDEITRSVAASTETHIVIAEAQAATRAASGLLRSGDLKAQDLVTRAWSRIFDQTPDAIEEAAQLAEQAILLDPTYPRAHFMRATRSCAACGSVKFRTMKPTWRRRWNWLEPRFGSRPGTSFRIWRWLGGGLMPARDIWRRRWPSATVASRSIRTPRSSMATRASIWRRSVVCRRRSMHPVSHFSSTRAIRRTSGGSTESHWRTSPPKTTARRSRSPNGLPCHARNCSARSSGPPPRRHWMTATKHARPWRTAWRSGRI